MQLQLTTITFALLAFAGHVAFANECLQDNLGNGFSSAIHDPSLGDSHYGQADDEMCYPKVHSISSGVSGNDDGVAMLVGGNYVGLKGAEIEGNMVVMGNFRVEQNGPSNFVSAGEGTQVTPHKGGECIKVGGDMSSAKRMEIFYPHYSCTAVVKGQRNDVNKIAPKWMTDKGFEYKQDSNLDMTKYEQQIDSLRAKSAYWSSLPTTEGASYGVSSRAFNIECTDDDVVQVFNIEASLLQGQGYDTYVFNENCTDKTVLINVQGTGSVKFTTKHTKWTKDGQVQSGGWANFPSCMNSAILWNFPNAVDVAVEGYDELQGSILTTGNLHWKSGSGQSGRTMVLGDLVHDSWGSEFHSFEFNPPKPLPDPNCEEVSPPTISDCNGEIIETSSITSLDFFNSVVTKNTLHLEGGELRYENVGIVRDREVDLVVTITGGDYTDIADVWEERGKAVDNMNGKKPDSTFANINLQTVLGKPKSGEGNFKFCFYDKGTEELTKVDTFRWTVFDTDERGGGIKEKMLMDVSQAVSFQLWPDTTRSEINTICEDGSSLPCNSGVRTIFHSSTVGSGKDNPTDPNMMTDQQKSRSVTFTFTDTDCWEFTYDHYCPSEQLDYVGQDTVCKSYSGGNFLFSGDSSEIINEGECVVSPPPPPPKPTKEPTESPTLAPVVPITESPTKSPTLAPVVPITDSPTGSLEVLGSDDDDDSFLPPLCPVDINIVKKSGETDFPAENSPVVTILSQDTSTVTVALAQEWTTKSVDSIFYDYKVDIWSNKCFAETDVNGGAVFDTITISCNIMTPTAYLQICVADNISNEILSIGDDATIPKCCHSEEVAPPNTPKVCYSLEIRCESACIDESEKRRTLRGSSSKKN